MHPTLLIGLDGATFTILDPLMEDGTMPFLREFVHGGSRAKLMSTPNPLTPPAWITLETGRTPGNHGVFDFIWAEERKSDHYFTLHNFRDIQCETIWSIVSRQNGHVCSLNYPMMAPPPPVAGCIVPGLVSWKHLRRNMHPKGLYDKFKALPGFNARELAWDFDLEKKAETGIPEEEYEHWVEYHIRREQLWFEITCYILKNEPWNLVSILFDGPDKISHMGYRFLDPAVFPKNPTNWEVKIRQLCLEFFRKLDGFMEEIVKIAGPETRVFMASDHGFGPSREVFRVNSWLHSKGYLTWKDLSQLESDKKKTAQRVIDRHFVLLDWKKTTAYARSATSNGIYIRVIGDSCLTGVKPENYESFRDQLITELQDVRDPETGMPIIKDILKKEEAFPGKNNKQAPDLTLVMRDHSFISIMDKKPILYKRPYVEGTHYPAGIFLAKGPGIRQGKIAPRMSIKDVTPCLMYSLGLDIPSDFEGKVPAEIFSENYFSSNPYKIGKETMPVGSGEQLPQAVPLTTDEEKEIYEQFKALGYVE